MQRTNVWGRLVRAEVGQLLQLLRHRLVEPRKPDVRSIRLAVAVVLLAPGMQLATAVAAPGPDPHPSATPKNSSAAPSPDPYPAEPAPSAGSASTAIAPAPAPTAAPRSASSTAEPQSSTSPTTLTAPSSRPTPASTTKTQPSSAGKRKTGTTRQVRDGEATAAPSRTVRNQPTRPSTPIAAALTDRVGGGELLLGGLALLALVLSSGSLLLLVTRVRGWETRA